jgi:glucose-1-phosphate thymidylyltransferase
MKGIILAGGAGTRLYPLTTLYNKQLLPVYNLPMIYYPLSTLILMGIHEILLISSPDQIPHYRQLLKHAERLGLRFHYAAQEKPNGLAEAFIIGAQFIANDSVTLILGDNIFYGKLDLFRQAIGEHRDSGARIFGYYVNDPQRYGVVEFDAEGKAISIEEKPENPKSHYAVPGLYIYDNEVVAIARQVQPSWRGELEITDVNRAYMNAGNLTVSKLGRGVAWLDTGTPKSMLEAANFIASLEQRQGLKIGALEESALRSRAIKAHDLAAVVDEYPRGDYRTYLEKVIAEHLDEGV